MAVSIYTVQISKVVAKAIFIKSPHCCSDILPLVHKQHITFIYILCE